MIRCGYPMPGPKPSVSNLTVEFSSGAPATRRLVLGDGDAKFLLELSIDVGEVHDIDQLDSDGMRKFTFALHPTALVQPASAASALSPLPAVIKPRLSIHAQGRDQQMYATDVVIEVTRAALEGPEDRATGMPTGTASFRVVSRTTRIDEAPPKTFDCVYCNHSHPTSAKSDEHIIPRALLNKNYVLQGVCARTNHYFSHAFEKRVLHLPVVEELLLMFEPPDKPEFRSLDPSGTPN